MGAKELGQAITAVMQAPTKRDKQVMVGPSNLGNPCERCLGLDLAGVLPGSPARKARADGTGLSAWIGTAMHLKLEQDIGVLKALGVKEWKKVELEKKGLVVGEIEGYGLITGTGDIFHDQHHTVCDLKGTKLAYIRDYRIQGIGIQYEVQRQSYAVGVKAEGFKVKEVMNKYIPRDSNSFLDIWDAIGKFDPRVVDKALKRATKIWQRVQDGELEFLKTDPECFDCKRDRNVRFIRG